MSSELTRRKVLWLGGALAAAAFVPVNAWGAAASPQVDAGNASKYAQEGIYPEFLADGFFVMRQGDIMSLFGTLSGHGNGGGVPGSRRR